jgi:membrane protease YdiL (CAAX protease family)
VRLPNRLGRSPDSPSLDRAVLRRRLAVGVTIVVATSLLAGTLRVRAGSTGFFIFGFGAAAAWILGAVVSGPIPLRPPHDSPRRVVPPAIVLGLLTFLGFLVADLIGRHLPSVSTALHNVLARADTGPLAVVLVVALVNGVGEELFFRGALFAALESHRPILSSTLIYVAVTAATGNVALVLAAAVMGTIFALQRAHTGSILASTVTHLCWSTLMLLALPR